MPPKNPSVVREEGGSTEALSSIDSARKADEQGLFPRLCKKGGSTGALQPTGPGSRRRDGVPNLVTTRAVVCSRVVQSRALDARECSLSMSVGTLGGGWGVATIEFQPCNTFPHLSLASRHEKLGQGTLLTCQCGSPVSGTNLSPSFLLTCTHTTNANPSLQMVLIEKKVTVL